MPNNYKITCYSPHMRNVALATVNVSTMVSTKDIQCRLPIYGLVNIRFQVGGRQIDWYTSTVYSKGVLAPRRI